MERLHAVEALTIALLLTACEKPTTPTNDAAAPIASVSSAASAAPTPVVTTCSFEHGFHGTLSPDLEVFMRLEKTGNALKGHYFYAKVGNDLAVTGTVTDAGVIHLSEGPTGELDGKCEADGHLRGSWQKPNGTDKRTFDLESIGPREQVLVATKTKARKFPPKPATEPPGGMFHFEKNESCVDSVSWPEVYGAGTPAIEAALNTKLVTSKWVLGKDEEAQLRSCVTGSRVKGVRTFDVLMNDANVLAIRAHEVINWEGGTHPWDPGVEAWRTFDTKTGTHLFRKELLDESKPGLAKAIKEAASKCAEGDDKLSLANPDLLIAPTPKGLQIAATGYPPPARVFEGNGPTIPWSTIVASGGLRDTVVSRYAAKAPAETAKCLERN